MLLTLHRPFMIAQYMFSCNKETSGESPTCTRGEGGSSRMGRSSLPAKGRRELCFGNTQHVPYICREEWRGPEDAGETSPCIWWEHCRQHNSAFVPCAGTGAKPASESLLMIRHSPTSLGVASRRKHSLQTGQLCPRSCGQERGGLWHRDVGTAGRRCGEWGPSSLGRSLTRWSRDEEWETKAFFIKQLPGFLPSCPRRAQILRKAKGEFPGW